MKVSKTIIISKEDILEYFVSTVENCTIMEAREIIKRADISYDIKGSGDYTRGTHIIELNKIKIVF